MGNNNTGYKDSPIGKIPSDWEVKELATITEKIGDGLHGTPEYITSSEWFFINGNNLKDGSILLTTDTKCVSEKEYIKLRKDLKYKSILMSINGTIGNVAFYKNEKIVLGKSAAYINCKDENVDYLFYFLQSQIVINFFEGELTGSTIRNLSLKSIREIPINIPPLPEQKAIAQLLSTWDDAISKTQALITQKELSKKWLMQNLLTGKKRLKGFSGEWKEYHLGEMFSERNETKYYNLPLLSVGANGIYPQSDSIKKDTSNEDKSKYRKICPGDIGYNTMRMWQGRNALSSLEGIISPAYTVVTPKRNADSLYFSYLFKTPKLMNQFWRNSQGLVDDTLNCKYKDFAIVKVNLPQSKEEQTAIAQVLQTADKEIQLLKTKLEKLKEQKKGLMQVLLTGRKRLQVNN